MIGDAFKWNKALPLILKDLDDSGFVVIHMRIDHMILIDRPLFICILDTRRREPSKSNRGDSPLYTSPQDGNQPAAPANQLAPANGDAPLSASKDLNSSRGGASQGQIRIEVDESDYPEDGEVSEEKVMKVHEIAKNHLDEERFDITSLALMPQANVQGSRSLHNQMGNPGKNAQLGKGRTRVSSTRSAMEMRRTFGEMAKSDRAMSKSMLGTGGRFSTSSAPDPGQMRGVTK